MASLRPCVGCGFDLDDEENLIVKGSEPREWPIDGDVGHEFCDVATGRVWHKPTNLPWGHWWSQQHDSAVKNIALTETPQNVTVTPYCQTEPSVAESEMRLHNAQFDVFFAMPPELTIARVRLRREWSIGGGFTSTVVMDQELMNNRPTCVLSDTCFARSVRYIVQAFYYGAGPCFLLKVNGICQDVGAPIPGIAGNHEPGGGDYYG